ncbi:MAG TPA: DoxX family protein [Methylophilaceae bacterium]|jgi:putative oxidoreductase|nr:DoxX family protein [Methylophilaceae bacterium]
MNPFMHLSGRILLASIFIISGLGKLANPAGTAGFMESMGVPGMLVWPTIALEILGGIALIIGFQTRIAAFALAAFSIAAAVIFHHNFSDQMQMIMFLKNFSIAGGLLLLSASGALALGVDCRK